MIVIFVLYILLLGFLSVINPTKYAIGYIIFVSLFFGIVPSDCYVYNGVDYCTLLLNISCIIPLIMYFPRIEKVGKYLIIFWAIFYVYGILRPIWLGYQDIMLSVKASKSYLTFAFASYLIVQNRKINYKQIFNFVLYLSLYFSLLYLISCVIPIKAVLQGYDKGDGIQCWYDSFIYFSLFYICSDLFNKTVKIRLLYASILLVGIYLGGYFSLFGCSLVFLIYICYLKATRQFSYGVKRFIGIFLALSIACFVLVLINSGYLNDIVSSQTAAIDSRGRNNMVREYLIAKEIVFGYGFISQNSSFIQGMMQDGNQYAQSLSFVDAGYIDLLGKFGLIGTVLFLIIPIWFVRYLKLKEDNVYVVLIISFYAINMTWAVLCYPMGVIILGLVFSYMIRTNKLKTNNYGKIKKLVRSESA